MRLKLLALIAVIVLASGCVSDSEPQTNNNQQPNNEPPADSSADTNSNNTIFFTNNGFEPQTLTIEQGETVTWIDRSENTPMWVGSDRHPHHTNYDGTSVSQHCENGESDTFDQCEAGDRYSFTFDKKGEWGYHNHEAFRYSGKIIVE